MTCQISTNINIVLPPSSRYQNQLLAWHTLTPLVSLGHLSDSLSIRTANSERESRDFDPEK